MTCVDYLEEKKKRSLICAANPAAYSGEPECHRPTFWSSLPWWAYNTYVLTAITIWEYYAIDLVLLFLALSLCFVLFHCFIIYRYYFRYQIYLSCYWYYHTYQYHNHYYNYHNLFLLISSSLHMSHLHIVVLFFLWLVSYVWTSSHSPLPPTPSPLWQPRRKWIIQRNKWIFFLFEMLKWRQKERKKDNNV